MIGATLRRLRTARGLTQKELAAPRYTHAYVSVIESGRRQPSRDALSYFAGKLGVSLEELVTGRPRDLPAKLELRLQEARLALSSGGAEGAAREFRALVREARRLDLPDIQARAEEGLGLYFERRGRPQDALGHYLAAEAIGGENSPSTRAEAVAGQARCHEALGDVRYAIHLLESLRADLARQDLPDPDAVVRIQASLVDAYLDAGLHRRALEAAEEVDLLAPRLTDPLRSAHMHMYMGRLHLSRGHPEQALRSLQRAEDAYRQLHLQTETGYAHLARGYVLSRGHKLRQARQELGLALGIFEQAGDTKDLTRTLNELARVARLEGRTELAADLLDRVLSRRPGTDEPILAWAHREYGLLLAETDPAGAQEHFEAAVELYERAGQSADVAASYRALGDLLTAQDQLAAANTAYRSGILAVEPVI